MTDISKNVDTRIIESEAAAWLAQLDGGNMSAQDLAAFQEWMGRSPLHQLEMKELAEVWGELNVLTDLMEPIARESANERKLSSRQKRNSSRVWLKSVGLTSLGLVMALMVFTSGMFNQSGIQKSQPTLIATNVGQHQTAILPDGSSVTLNTNTKIEVDFDDQIRKIRLLNGEAMFDVIPDKTRPFSVYAGDGVVRAVGTVFSVHIKNETVNVIVSEGAVEVSSILEPQVTTKNTPQIALAAGFVKSGHKAVLRNKRTIIEPIGITQVQEDLLWTDGLITFSQLPLEQVVAEVSRYTTLDISISTPEAKNIRIGGVFPTGDMEALFEALELGFGISVVRPSENEVVLSSTTQQ